MALTSEQRAANGVAKLARDRAYRARYKEFRDTEERAEAEIKAKYEERIQDADAAVDALYSEYSRVLADYEERMRVLQEEKQAAADAVQDRKATAHATRSDLYDTQHNEVDEAKNRIAAGFPDMVGQARWSAAVWKDYKDFL